MLVVLVQLAAILTAAASSNIPVRQPQLPANLIPKSTVKLESILMHDTKKYWRQNSYDTKKNIGAKTAMYQQQRHATLESEVGAKLTFCD